MDQSKEKKSRRVCAAGRQCQIDLSVQEHNRNSDVELTKILIHARAGIYIYIYIVANLAKLCNMLFTSRHAGDYILRREGNECPCRNGESAFDRPHSAKAPAAATVTLSATCNKHDKIVKLRFNAIAC